jgi:hypothetical protein
MMIREPSTAQPARWDRRRDTMSRSWPLVPLARAGAAVRSALPKFIAVSLLSLASVADCTPFRDETSDGTPLDSSAGASSSSPLPTGCDLAKPFGAPTFTPGLIPLAPQQPQQVRLSADGLSVYFAAQGPSSAGFDDLYAGTRATLQDAFGAFFRLSTLDTRNFDWWPSVSGDGLAIVYEITLPDVGGAQHIYYGTRAEGGSDFSYGGTLDSVNSLAGDNSPFLMENGRVLYLSSTRASPSDWDLYRADAVGTVFGPTYFGTPVAVSELNTSDFEGSPAVTPDDRVIYFGSNRPDGGLEHIWTAQRTDPSKPFSAPTSVDELRSFGIEQIPSFITSDGCTLYLTIRGADQQLMAYVAQKPQL